MGRFFYTSLVIILLLEGMASFAQDEFIGIYQGEDYYPESSWEEYVFPEQVGFNPQSLFHAKNFYDSINAASVLVLYKGKILLNWGDNTRRLRSASVRKSFLHALLGLACDEKKFNLEDELEKFKIAEFDGLSDLEKTAKIKDLLSTSSGVYLPAAYEPQVWTDRKPERGSNKPGKVWYYNNWDFNALGTIYEHITKGSIGEDFYQKIAVPIGMQDFRPDLDFKYFFEKEITIPAYLFKMSARDMARFGLLYLRNGKWKGNQLISRTWVETSGKSLRTPWEGAGYGYLWWNTKTDHGDKVFYASGTGVQGIYVVPAKDLIMVFRSDTYMGPEVRDGLEIELLNRILDAQVSGAQEIIETKSTQWNKSYSSRHNAKEFQHWIGQYKNNITNTLSISMESNQLVLKTKITDFLMFPISENMCWIEDLNIIAVFEQSAEQKGTSLLTKDKLVLYN